VVGPKVPRKGQRKGGTGDGRRICQSRWFAVSGREAGPSTASAAITQVRQLRLSRSKRSNGSSGCRSRPAPVHLLRRFLL
jgi:hypothetical protein